MVRTMPSTRRLRESSISVTSDAGDLSTGSPNVRIGNVVTEIRLRGGVPPNDGPPPMLVAENRYGGGVEGQTASLFGGQSEVGHGQDAQDVPVGEQQHVARAVLGPDVVDQALATGGGVLEALAARRSLGEEVPLRPLCADLGARAALVLAVVHLDQEMGDFG